MERLWQKQYCRGVPTSIDFEPVTLPNALSRTASRFSSTNALMFQGTTITFKQLDELVGKFSWQLRSLGVKPGDRVSILLPNLIQTAVAIYGALRIGAVVVMHNPRADDMMLEHQIRDAGSQILICLDVLIPRMMKMRERVGIKNIVACHIRDYLPFMKKKLFAVVKPQLHLKTPQGEGILEFMDLIDGVQGKADAHPAQLDDPAFILYTSATTGKSKGVELPHATMSCNVQQLRAMFPTFRDGSEIVVACLPFFHVFGLTCALNIGVYYGFGNILVPLPDPDRILEAIDMYRATFIPALPTFYTDMMASPQIKKYDLTSLKGCFCGGAPLPLETIHTFERLTGAQICEGYGLTEASPVTHINPFGGKTKPGTIGLPVPNTDAKIVDIDHPTVEITTPGVPGELCISGPQVMKGYLHLPEETAAALRDGWLFTGDVVIVDHEGYFSVVDRKKDLISSDMGTVYPRDVDEVLFTHPKILEACAIGIPDNKGGEVVKAYVVLKTGQSASGEEIIDYCAARLERQQVPREVDFLTALPKSPVGKIVRKELRRIHLVKKAGPILKTEPGALSRT
jgi:long-chain acyl-CoA synthetase